MTPQRQRALEAFEAEGGNMSRAAKRAGIARQTMQTHVRAAGINKKPLAAGSLGGRKVIPRKLPRKGKINYFLLTSAQNNTHIHENFVANLKTYLALLQDHPRVDQAELMVGSFTYNQNQFGKLSVKRNTDKGKDTELWYDERITPYIVDERVSLAPGLIWCGEMNILPTAVNPLSGLETYTGRKSAIIPHAKIALTSVPSGKFEATKFNYTTGTITLRNYIQKKEGNKAEFHHAYAALIVGVNSEGHWWVRQINATDDGSFCELGPDPAAPGIRVENETVHVEPVVENITWGDIHALKIDPVVKKLAWSPGGIVDVVKPRSQTFHDLFDMWTRNHHEMGNCHAMFERYVEGEDKVEEEVQVTADFLNYAHRDGCLGIAVESNHNLALERWLREADYRKDPPNAIYFLTLQKRVYEAIRDRDRSFHLMEFALRGKGCPGPEQLRFLQEDESFVICPDAGGGIELGMHGHAGPNGSRGTPRNLARMGRRANSGHTHTTQILDGLYVAGCSCLLDMKYNKGPSSWSHSHIFTFKNGKRTLVTMFAGGYRE